jgi:hypothetical protein
MKHLICTIAAILTFTIGLKSQNYIPFPTENVNWNVYYRGTCHERPPDTILLRYTIRGDTTINDISYKKLCLERGDTINPIIEAIGGIREKDKKIYYNGKTIYSSTDEEEYLLYDFTKQIGDTIKHNPQGWFFSVILDIDSIMIDGTYRKRYEVDNHWFYQNPDYIIEGIGSVKNGLLGHISDIPTCGTHYWEHICFKENGVVKYMNPNFDDCFPDNLLMGAKFVKSDTQIKIYPNPVDQNLQIEKNTNENLSIKIIDIYGRTIIERHINDIKTIIKLDIKPGVYNGLITNKDGQILITPKIIKQ